MVGRRDSIWRRLWRNGLTELDNVVDAVCD